MHWTKQYSKAVTFSYDDGVLDDFQLIDILNKYNLKATFNVNSGIQDSSRIPLHKWKETYQGHEVAVHSYSHPNLTECTQEELVYQLEEDKRIIEQTMGVPCTGMAYPFGDFSDSVVNQIQTLGLQYARTVISNHTFKPQTDLLRFQPTCHHEDEQIFEVITQFLQSTSDAPQILYIWGHSYEFSNNRNWDRFEQICSMLANHKDIFYGTNSEVLLT